ncbi:MAG TPA: CAP domain-containing protein [Gemmataceae bacterium]|jgi:uncharacterized protein YkwD
MIRRSLLSLGLCLIVIAADDPPPKIELSAAEQAILDATNKEREKENLPALKPNPILFEAARAHSANMAKQGKMEHELDGKTPADRIKAAGYDYAYIAENIGVSNGNSPGGIVKAWMESKIHKENILNEKCTEIGIGVVKNDKGETYYTQEFGAPKKK